MSLFRSRQAKIHFVGVGGIGMSGIAEVLLNLGYTVSGSDLRESETTRRLAGLGGHISYGHAAENVLQVDVVVISSAVKRDNPEVLEARRRKIPVIPRAEMLAELMRLKYGVAIAGSHGKTTTTSMAAHLLAHAGLDPTAVVGGKVNAFGSNAKLGKGDYMVVEADESDGSFLRIPPTIAIVTNIDPEHLDHWKTPDALRRGFVDFVNRVPFYGLAILCIDHPTVQSILPDVEKRVVTYGESHQADYRAEAIELSGHAVRFDAFRRDEALGRFEVAMVGRHNALNALAVIALGDEMGIPPLVTREALRSFQGVQRRFTVRGEVAGVTVVDDYGHHPAEVKATLQGAREAFKRRVVCLFQPHRYTRTRDLMAEFATAFNDADVLLLTDIYAAGEEPIPGATAANLAEAIRAWGHRDVTVVPRAELARAARERIRPGDLVLTLGAGDVTAAGPELLALLER
ncbi:UDP-N-acetylmuramate--L-alanine ligase [Anaeromyxobacter dehalogenans]|uniref:UDP-N-acetylmuramate--L-alanine ligase n=1 Tax=Anaeromyxobacter dehalogenans (strain 2CP-C) TaxID=290397 RepID=MURC_ANADE|nr:UDP-N-acetylmuramate--L-alanine ligase [Anaeromyxobacter dehalogenans]Q2IG30.1 RecName: Full=UDP-N-acetylmuramate--L-alanine ligase; AltName: Full=UDP-N-acetylmuramoyl-L-alanine synthetase [Anaeromyxobacter dehalogenans 2CP-C]ABC83538.1 UDP-N-acetylmuramate--L-alanine ligase [Anaeromyxobacter dehalogenans 2CP-C]